VPQQNYRSSTAFYLLLPGWDKDSIKSPAADIDFIAPGGKLNKDLNCFVGPDAERVIEHLNGSKFFFSTASILIEGGISDIYDPDENIIKVKMYKRTKVSYLLVDSTKFGRESTIKWF
jgi:DeoR/GlpR family transcriptional regulator of sugar metabolism